MHKCLLARENDKALSLSIYLQLADTVFVTVLVKLGISQDFCSLFDRDLFVLPNRVYLRLRTG